MQYCHIAQAQYSAKRRAARHRKRSKQVITRRDDMPPPRPIAADLRPCADGSAVRTALVAWPRRAYLAWVGPTEGQTDGRIAASLNAPYGRGDN